MIAKVHIACTSLDATRLPKRPRVRQRRFQKASASHVCLPVCYGFSLFAWCDVDDHHDGKTSPKSSLPILLYAIDSKRSTVKRRLGDMASIPTHFRKIGDNLEGWFVENLWILAEELPVKDINLDDVGVLDSNRWFRSESQVPTVRNISLHCKQIMEADLQYPIILCPQGRSMDGSHRVAKAYMLGHKTIKAVQFKVMPKADVVRPFDTTRDGK